MSKNIGSISIKMKVKISFIDILKMKLLGLGKQTTSMDDIVKTDICTNYK